MQYITYTYLLTPLHTGASSQAGNVMGIARETHTNLPYLPSSSLRGKIRSVIESLDKENANLFFGKRLEGSDQPTEGDVWFADATLLMFPVASYSHQYLWITCPLWLGRWNRWLDNSQLKEQIDKWRLLLNSSNEKKAISSTKGSSIYLQGALLQQAEIESIDQDNIFWDALKILPNGNGILDLKNKLVILSDEDCAGLVETGLQREVRVALKEDSKTVDGGSFRAEEAIPSEAILFFPWGIKKTQDSTQEVRDQLELALNDRLQFGGLESIGRGWTELTTIEINKEIK